MMERIMSKKENTDYTNPNNLSNTENDNSFNLSPELESLKKEFEINHKLGGKYMNKELEESIPYSGKDFHAALRFYRNIFFYIILTISTIIVIYPVIWMFAASLKNNPEVFKSLNIFKGNFTLSSYKQANRNYSGNINIIKATINSCIYVIPVVFLTIISSLLTAYGFSRFNFTGKKLFKAIMLGCIFMPQTVLNIPQYMMFNKLGLIGSKYYLPLIIPSAFATDSYFIYMFMQFFKSLPKEVEETAIIDGAGPLNTLWFITLPSMIPSIVVCAILKFIWTFNDFLGPLLYVKIPEKYPASLFVRLSLDSDAIYSWNRVFATSFTSILPAIILFLFTQKHLTEDVAGTEIKK